LIPYSQNPLSSDPKSLVTHGKTSESEQTGSPEVVSPTYKRGLVESQLVINKGKVSSQKIQKALPKEIASATVQYHGDSSPGQERISPTYKTGGEEQEIQSSIPHTNINKINPAPRQDLSGDYSDILNKFSNKNKPKPEGELMSSEPVFMKPPQKVARSSLPRSIQNHSVGKTRPVKPAANLNNSMISGEGPNMASRTSFNQAQNSMKHLLPQKRQSKTELLENQHNVSTIEPYYMSKGYGKMAHDRSFDQQSLNQTYYDESGYFPTEGDQAREKRSSIKLPSINNPNAT